MTANNRLLISFIAIAAPFLLWLGYEFFIIGVTYWDRTPNYALEHWIHSSIGWDLSEWPLFLHNAAGGFRTHYPSIPETQLAAIYGSIFGWPGENLEDFASFGIWLNVIAIIIAAAWGALIARNLKIPALPLFAAAALAASNPAYAFTWLVYPHLLPLFVPVGLAIYALSQEHSGSAKSHKFVFLVLGYLLSMHYISIQPIVALVAAIFVSLWAMDGGPVYRMFSEKQTALLKRIIIVVLLLTLFIGFAAVLISLSERTSQFISASKFSATAIVLTTLIAGVVIFAVGWFVLRKFKGPQLAQFFFATAGDGVIGLAIGANLLFFMSWQRGFLGAFGGAGSNALDLNLMDLFRFLFLAGAWQWITPVLLLGALYIGIRSLLGKDDAAGRNRFISIFVLALIALSLLQLMPKLADIAAEAKGSILEFYSARFLVGFAVAAPVILVWFWKYNRYAGNLLSVATLAVAMFAAQDYHRYATNLKSGENKIEAYVKDSVGSYLKSNPDTQIVCIENRMAGLCSVDFIWFHYRFVHKANTNNEPLPAIYASFRNRFLILKKRNCQKLETCLGVPSVRNYPILVAGREANFPDVVRSAGKPIKSGLPTPNGILIVEIPGAR